MNDLLEAKADIRTDAPKKAQGKQPFFEKGLSKEMDQAMLEGKTVVLSAMYEDEEADEGVSAKTHRRRQQKNLQLIKNNRAK